jgi:ribosomal protein S18 acetylase RimI-like enzyme
MSAHTYFMEQIENKEKQTPIHIYDAVPDDVEGIIEVQKITWLATYPNEEYGITLDDIKEKDFSSQERIKRWKKGIETQTNENHMWVAKDSKTVVGFCSTTKKDGKHEIRAIYILPDYQGKGVGRKLITAALNWLGEDKEVFINVAKYNNSSIEFYKRVGFKEIGDVASTEIAKLPSGKIIPEIRMIKKV